MKITTIKPGLPFEERWYAQPLTCPNCFCEFTLEEPDLQRYTAPYDDFRGNFAVSHKGVDGPCPHCWSAIYIERPE